MARKTDKARNRIDDIQFMSAIARIIGKYDSGKVATQAKIAENMEAHGYPMPANRQWNTIMRLKSYSYLTSDWEMEGVNHWYDEDGKRHRRLPGKRGYVLTILGWHELENATHSDAN